MTVCAVVLAKDEADIIETTVRHLAAHVDEVVVSDNLSADGTSEILLALREELGIEVRYDGEPGYYQAEKTTRLALEALERGHGWVVPCDADEFWFAGDGRSLRDYLDGVPRDVQFVKAAIFNHVATAYDPEEPNPVRRLGWRQRQPLAIQWGKVACRLRPDLEIHMGNHSASTRGVGRTELGLEIRHFPYRSAEHFVHKAEVGLAAYRAAPELLERGYGSHWRVYGEAVEAGGPEAGEAWFYDAFFSRDPAADGSLEFDPAPVAWPPLATAPPPPEEVSLWRPPTQRGRNEMGEQVEPNEEAPEATAETDAEAEGEPQEAGEAGEATDSEDAEPSA